MMRVGDHPAGDLARRLRNSGISLRTGAFVTHLRLDLLDLIEQFQELYQDYSVDDTTAIFDFQVAIGPSSPFRRFVHPKVQANIDGGTPFRPLPARIAYPMMESALNWCITQRVARHVLLHAAVVERDGYAVVLPAPSGSGKSTLCAALVCSGWRLLSDEIAIIRTSDYQLVANPRPIGLKNESIQTIGEFAPQAHFGARFEGTVKGTVAFMRPPRDSVARSNESAAPRLVILPRFQAQTAARLERVEKAQGFMALIQNSINYHTCLKLGFDTISQVVDSSEIYKLAYGDLNDALGIIDQLHRPGRH